MHNRLTARRLTRREALYTAGAGAGALALSAAAWQAKLVRLGASFVPLTAADAPQFVSRPDLHLPGLTVASSAAGMADGLILLAPYNAPHNAQAGAVIVAPSGHVVWEQPLPQTVTTDLRVQTYRGKPALTWWQGVIEYGHGVGGYVIADSDYAPIARVSAGNGLHGDLHEFLLTDRGTALLTSYVITKRDLRAVGGAADGSIQDAILQELDIASGRVLFEWHSLEHIPITDSYYPLSSDWDYVHLNSIAVDLDGNLLVSGRNTHTIYKIDRRSGAIMWRLGGKHTDFALTRDAVFAWQHDARRQPDGSITVFDNGNKISRALVLAVDERARTASMTHQYTHPAKLFANSQGNMQVLPNGNIFVGWGAQPYVSEFAPDGSLLYDARLGNDYISYRAYRSSWTASGVGTPAVVARRGREPGRTTVYVSWNGDTTVARWSAATVSGTTLSSAPRTGFETAITVPSSSARVVVVGHDANRRQITRSQVIGV